MRKERARTLMTRVHQRRALYLPRDVNTKFRPPPTPQAGTRVLRTGTRGDQAPRGAGTSG